jgi:uncharacterized repeat protein (TIGR02543 family)
VYFRKVLEVSFDGNGGSIEEEPHTVKQGLSYGELPVPVRDGYLFDGWYTQPEGGEEINCDSIVSLGESHTLYARWKREGEDAEISNSSDTPPDSSNSEKVSTPEKVTWKKSIAKKGKRIQLRWKKVKGADGYQITIAGSRAFKKAKNTNTATNKIILKKKKAAQYVRIRAYKKDATGKKVYGAYSRVKKVKAYQ